MGKLWGEPFFLQSHDLLGSNCSVGPSREANVVEVRMLQFKMETEGDGGGDGREADG